MIIFGLVGIVYIITRSRLTQTIRAEFPNERLRYMLSCAQCTGFWVGFLFYLVTMPELSNVLHQSYSPPILLKTLTVTNIIAPFLYGGLISLLSSLTVNLLELIAFAKDWLITHMGQ